jgi:hypothetical protein
VVRSGAPTMPCCVPCRNFQASSHCTLLTLSSSYVVWRFNDRRGTSGMQPSEPSSATTDLCMGSNRASSSTAYRPCPSDQTTECMAVAT